MRALLKTLQLTSDQVSDKCSVAEMYDVRSASPPEDAAADE